MQMACNTSWQIEVPNYSMNAPAPSDINMGPFGRLAQATYLLDQVHRHVSDYTMTDKYREEEAVRLDRALRALITFTTSETARRQGNLCSQMALCHRYLPLALGNEYMLILTTR
jgi:hypothetical protein